MDGFQPLNRAVGASFGFQIGHLAAHHAHRARSLGQDLDTTYGGWCRVRVFGHNLERQCQQGIAGQNRGGLIKGLVASGTAST